MDAKQAKHIIKAVKSGDLETVRDMVRNDRELLLAEDRDGSQPLHCAAWKGHHEIAMFLIAEGADINAVTENGHWGTTPLHAAAHAGHKSLVELMIAHGADIHFRSSLNNLTALGHARVHKAKAVEKLLLENGADE